MKTVYENLESAKDLQKAAYYIACDGDVALWKRLMSHVVLTYAGANQPIDTISVPEPFYKKLKEHCKEQNNLIGDDAAEVSGHLLFKGIPVHPEVTAHATAD